MDFRFTDEEEAFRGELQSFLKQELPPEWDGMDDDEGSSERSRAFSRRMSKKLAEKGWLTMAWPREHGGQERSIMEQLLYREETAYQRVPGTDMGTGGVSWVGPTLMRYGTEEQKRHLQGIANGDEYWCTLYSEPGSGSDLASLQTKAVRDGDDYVINGSKTWTSGGHLADMGWLAARTDADAPKHKGISMFLLDMKTPGVTVRPLINMAGSHHFNEVFFDDVRIPQRERVGDGPAHAGGAGSVRAPVQRRGARARSQPGAEAPLRRDGGGDVGSAQPGLPRGLDAEPGPGAQLRGLGLQALRLGVRPALERVRHRSPGPLRADRAGVQVGPAQRPHRAGLPGVGLGHHRRGHLRDHAHHHRHPRPRPAERLGAAFKPAPTV